LEARVRRADERDLSSMESVIAQHWKVSVDHKKELANKDAVLLVAENIGEPETVIGTGLMWITGWNKTGYLVELAVDKAHLRKGVGKALVSEFSRIARQNQLRAIIVETQPSNKDGVDFYLSNGFRLCGFHDRYYTNHPKSSKDIAIFLSLDLE